MVFTIYDVKIAMPTCPVCMEYRFSSADANGRVSGQYQPSVRDVIAHPERLRYIADNSDKVELDLWNDWRPEANRGLFLARSDPRSLPHTGFKLIFYRHDRAKPCWTEVQPGVECLVVHHLDKSERHKNQVVASLNFIQGSFAYDPPDQIGGFVLPVGYSFYLAPIDHARDAIGLPVRMKCSPLKTCENSAFGAGVGFALRRSVDLFFRFRENSYPIDKWVAMHDRVIDAVSILLLAK